MSPTETSPEVMAITLIDFDSSVRTVHSPKDILFEAYKEEPTGTILAIPECCHIHMGSRHHVIANEIVESYSRMMPTWNEWFRENTNNGSVDG